MFEGFEDVVALVERDFPRHEWLVRQNRDEDGKYFANIYWANTIRPLRPVNSAPPQFSAYGKTPMEALKSAYYKLVAVVCD